MSDNEELDCKLDYDAREDAKEWAREFEEQGREDLLRMFTPYGPGHPFHPSNQGNPPC